MTIPNEAFNQVPIDTRVAGSYFEIDGSRASGFVANHTALIIGQSLAAGTADDDVAVLVPGTGESAGALFGAGSILAMMVAAFRENNPTMTLYALPMADLEAGVEAKIDVTITGTATENRALPVYIAGKRVFVQVAVGDTATNVATAMAAALNGAADLPVLASSAAGVVTLTAKNAGEVGNDIRFMVAVRGEMSGEKVPAGIAISAPGGGFLSGGSGNPDVSGALAAIGSQEFNYVGVPWTDGATLDALSAWLETRQAAGSEVDVKAFAGRRGTLSELVTFGTSRNDRFVSVIESYDAPMPAFARGMRYMGQASAKLFNHPARPLYALELIGEMAPPEKSRFGWVDKNTLLFSGIAVTDVSADGKVRINMPITLYQTNQFGDRDEAYLLVNTVAQLGRIRDELQSAINTRIMSLRPILVDDGTPTDENVAHVTPKSVKATLIAHYAYLQGLGFVENLAEFEKRLQVGKSATNSYRLNVIYPPDLSNPLYVLATQIAFELDFRNY
ncbi:phage tail sheath subtilisin-like domain-containing protein [Thalassospira marina]|uniref:Phage tail protein n=1 Tax=Thalassospira marina TaxID=2048283 RepID=A0A2N3KJM9_9PROT|nr:phage tail sheath subtilisin-like domain-containing protein [Thalassospira marina]PKR50769.1 phage tail protein [Thalassospira marina]